MLPLPPHPAFIPSCDIPSSTAVQKNGKPSPASPARTLGSSKLMSRRRRRTGWTEVLRPRGGASTVEGGGMGVGTQIAVVQVGVVVEVVPVHVRRAVGSQKDSTHRTTRRTTPSPLHWPRCVPNRRARSDTTILQTIIHERWDGGGGRRRREKRIDGKQGKMERVEEMKERRTHRPSSPHIPGSLCTLPPYRRSFDENVGAGTNPDACCYAESVGCKRGECGWCASDHAEDWEVGREWEDREELGKEEEAKGTTDGLGLRAESSGGIR
ncbi:hypothetical protein B0H19DRAFT_1202871 [Mycena capillaripes]|nr:hypothetical protein B0H19DRAFT_1202871 [Mycena capillaripes]